MHQKKFEGQIGKESSGVSSDFNPTPRRHHHHPQQQQFPNFQFSPHSNFTTNPQKKLTQPTPPRPGPAPLPPKPTPHKRPIITHPNPIPKPLSKSPTLSNSVSLYPFKSHDTFKLPAKKPAAVDIVLRRLRRVRIHLRCVLFLYLPFFYFLVSHPSRSLLLDSLSASAFAAALLFSLNLALPRLPSIRLLKKLRSKTLLSRPLLPVFWSIGSGPKKVEKIATRSGGYWVQVFSNGDVYEGEFHKGKCSGSGVYYYSMSGKYEGDWVDGKYDGYGVETWARGSRYRGQYRQGLRHGFGVYRFYTGDVYGGEWSNGQSHGCGIHTCEDGSRFVGEFKWGVKHGLGHYHFRNGDVYAGEYFADKMHGFGMYRFATGHRYEGAWHEGKRQGLGIYTFRDGETQSGHWTNGILDVPSTQNTTYPVSPVAVYHSRVLNTVQEVRRAAERAYDVAKVDERVNRAVAAANRAANAARVAAIKAVQNQLR